MVLWVNETKFHLNAFVSTVREQQRVDVQPADCVRFVSMGGKVIKHHLLAPGEVEDAVQVNKTPSLLPTKTPKPSCLTNCRNAIRLAQPLEKNGVIKSQIKDRQLVILSLSQTRSNLADRELNLKRIL